MKQIVIALLFSVLGLTEYKAKVIGITDGDTIVVLGSGNENIRIRLEGIDCPEKDQAFGSAAKKAASDFCFGKEVVIKTTGEDRYGRTLAFVYVGDSCLNEYLLRNGFAWHYKKYNSDPKLAEMERVARSKKVGLWAQSDAIAPWEWRKKTKFTQFKG